MYYELSPCQINTHTINQQHIDESIPSLMQTRYVHANHGPAAAASILSSRALSRKGSSATLTRGINLVLRIRNNSDCVRVTAAAGGGGRGLGE